MIGVEEARSILLKTVRRTAVGDMSLGVAAGMYLSRSVVARHPHPLFDMSAVDGYAFRFSEAERDWKVVAHVAAGDRHTGELGAGACVRIFTGAEIPAGADTVVMQEFVTQNGDLITHADPRLRKGANVRRQGEQLAVGDVVLEAGTRLGPAEVGLLASVGVYDVQVHAKPRVLVVRTGNEFSGARDPAPGRIFSSNEHMLVAALAEEGVQLTHEVFTPRDERGELAQAISAALAHSDVVITTGGVSVGEHDLVRSVLEELGCTIRFHGVKQKPGKPMLFATLGEKAVFGLPGNPRAVLVAWHLYVRPFLRAMQGAVHPWLKAERMSLAQPLHWKDGRSEFRAGVLRDGRVQLLPEEGSHMLAGMTLAEVLVELPADGGELPQDAGVIVHHLPER